MTQSVSRLRTIAEYQFGRGAGQALFPDTDDDRSVRRSSSGRIRQVKIGGEHLVSVGRDGRLTLGVGGGRRLHAALDKPTARVVIGDESEPYVRDGRSVFAKFVKDVDPTIRGRDEVAIVHHDGRLVGVGRAELDATAMTACDGGVAVRTRDGVGAEG